MQGLWREWMREQVAEGPSGLGAAARDAENFQRWRELDERLSTDTARRSRLLSFGDDDEVRELPVAGNDSSGQRAAFRAATMQTKMPAHSCQRNLGAGPTATGAVQAITAPSNAKGRANSVWLKRIIRKK